MQQHGQPLKDSLSKTGVWAMASCSALPPGWPLHYRRRRRRGWRPRPTALAAAAPPAKVKRALQLLFGTADEISVYRVAGSITVPADELT